MMHPEEIPLKGGSTSAPVKVGDTVHRVAGAWTPTVQALLAYLAEHGFEYSPRPLGVDAQGREVLGYLQGEAGHRPWPEALKTDAGLQQVGHMLKQYHEVVAGFVPAADAEWRVGRVELKTGQIIRHGDLGPWNTLWQGERLTGLIDWDFAEPGERITDVAQLVWYYAPMRGEKAWREAGFAERPDFVARARVLVESYGDFDLKTVFAELDRLQGADLAITERLGGAGVYPWNLFYDRGGVQIIEAENAWFKQLLGE